MFRYGGIGGSVAADTTAYLAAVGQANQFSNNAAEVIIPVTTSGFFISTGAVAKRPLKIRGYGSLTSLLVAQSDINLLILDNSGTGGAAGKACVLEDFGMTGIYTGATANGLTLKSAHDTIMRGMRITGFGIGLYFYSGSNFCCKIQDSRIEGNVGRNIFAAANTNALTMINVAFGSAGTNLTPLGMTIVDSNSLVMVGADCEGLRATTAGTAINGSAIVFGIDIDATSTLVADHKIGCHFENNANTVGEIRVGATSKVRGVTIDGGTLMANSASGAYGLNLLNASGVLWNPAVFFSDYGTANINYGTTDTITIVPADGLTTQGTFSLGNGAVILPQSAASQTLTNNATITTLNLTVIRVNEAGNVTGIIMQTAAAAQDITVINESNATITFAASSSHVADGSTSAIPALCSRKFTWNTVAALWFRAA